jgi:hypothetical protein
MQRFICTVTAGSLHLLLAPSFLFDVDASKCARTTRGGRVKLLARAVAILHVTRSANPRLITYSLSGLRNF